MHSEEVLVLSLDKRLAPVLKNDLEEINSSILSPQTIREIVVLFACLSKDQREEFILMVPECGDILREFLESKSIH